MPQNIHNNLLIIGFGTMGKIHAEKIQQKKAVTHVAIVDNNEQRRQEAHSAGYTAVYSDLDAAHSDHPNFDVVVITSNTVTHYSLIQQIILKSSFLELPLPALFIEKPIVASKEQALKLQVLLAEHGYPAKQELMCGYLLRESPAVEKLIQKIITDRETVSSVAITWQKQRKPDRASAGVIQDEATHSLDLVQYILKRLGIEPVAHSINILSATRTRSIVNTVEQDQLYTETDPNRNPFAEINYALNFGDVKVTGLSTFMQGPQERSISFTTKNRSYKLVFDKKGQDWCDSDAFANDKIASLWETFISALESGNKPVHMASINEAFNDVFLTTAIEEEADRFLLQPAAKLVFSKPKPKETYCGFEPGFLLKRKLKI
jgi:predicted dehydrogenase